MIVDEGRAVDVDHRDVVGDAFGRLCRLAMAGDAEAVQLLEAMAERFAKAAADVVDLLDLDEVVFGGPLWDGLAPVFLRILPDLLRPSAAASTIHSVTVRGTSVGADVAAVGAACLVLDEAFSPRSTTLLVTR
jgi:predicted NBD/HSP70 family sugar kinase